MSKENTVEGFQVNTKKPKKESKSKHRYDKHKPGQITPLDLPQNQIEVALNSIRESFKFMEKPIALLDKDLIYDSNRKMESYPMLYDLGSGQAVRGVIGECRWFEKGTLREGEKLRTTYRYKKIAPSLLESCVADAIEKLKETHPEAYGKLRESTEDVFNSPGSANYAGPGPGIFLPIPPNDLMVQQYIRDFWLQAAEARWLYNNFGPIHGGIQVLTAFVIGDGAKFQLKDKNAQVVFDEFESRTNLQARLFDIGLTGMIYGEIILQTPEVLVNNETGYVRLWCRNPANLWEIITDVNNLEDILAYYFNYSTRWLLQTVDGNPMVKYIIEMVPPEEIIHIKFNSLEDEARGRSQVQSAISDAKQLQDYMNARIIKAYNSAALVIDHKIEGDSTDVAAAAQQEGNLIAPGAIVCHNDSESYEILKGDMGNDSKSGLQAELLTQIALALGVPPVYLGASESGSRAMALSQTDPASKIFNTIRSKFEGSFMALVKRVLAVAIRAGRLPANTSTDVEIIFPELTSADVGSKIDLILQAQANGTYDHKTASQAIAKELDNTTYDYDDTQTLIKQQIAQNPKLDPLIFVPPGKAPTQGPGGQTTSPKQQSTNQSRSAYSGASMGLSSDNKNQVSQSLESQVTHLTNLVESLVTEKGAGANHAPKVHDKKAKTSLHKVLRSRTKDTIFSAESNGSTLGALTTDGVVTMPNETMTCAEDCSECAAVENIIKMYKGAKIDPANAIEVTPPDFPEHIKSKIKDEYPDDATAFAVMWSLRGQGYV